MQYIHIFGNAYGWTSDTTLNLTIEDRKRLLKFIQKDSEEIEKSFNK